MAYLEFDVVAVWRCHDKGRRVGDHCQSGDGKELGFIEHDDWML